VFQLKRIVWAVILSLPLGLIATVIDARRIFPEPLGYIFPPGSVLAQHVPGVGDLEFIESIKRVLEIALALNVVYYSLVLWILFTLFRPERPR
jgi:hypothetical protein